MPRPFAMGSLQSRSAENAGITGRTGKGAWARLLGWSRKRKANSSPQSATRHLPGLKLEALEPRFLLSADIIPFRIDMALGDDGAGAQYSLKYDNLIAAVMVFDDRSNTLIDQRSAQDIESSASSARRRTTG